MLYRCTHTYTRIPFSLTNQTRHDGWAPHKHNELYGGAEQVVSITGTLTRTEYERDVWWARLSLVDPGVEKIRRPFA